MRTCVRCGKSAEMFSEIVHSFDCPTLKVEEEMTTISSPLSAIIKKVEGRWIVDVDSNHVFEGNEGIFADGAYQEIEVGKITPLRKHPNNPSS